MVKPRATILLWLMAGFTGLLAQAPMKEELAKQIAGLPWATGQVVLSDTHDLTTTIGDSTITPILNSAIMVSAHYVNPEIIADTDTRYISFYPHWYLDKAGKKIGFGIGSGGSGVCRDGQDRWCNGTGEFENVTKDGFEYHLNLDWHIDGQSQKSFNETFHCLWLTKQTFKKNGFTITVAVKMK